MGIEKKFAFIDAYLYTFDQYLDVIDI